MTITKYLQKARKIFTNKEMFIAYCKWLLALTFNNCAPKLKITNHIYIGGWISFSEYYSFRCGISSSEKAFMGKYLDTGSKSNKISFDIGANIGIFTAYLTTFDSTIVHSFEPVPFTFSRL